MILEKQQMLFLFDATFAKMLFLLTKLVHSFFKNLQHAKYFLAKG